MRIANTARGGKEGGDFEDWSSGLNCLYVIVERAHNLRAGDMFTSGPFVMVTILDGDENEVAKGKTSVRHNTVNPKWNEEFAFRYDWRTRSGSSMPEAEGDCDDSNMWTMAESSKQQRSCGRLIFEVCDYDLISPTKRGGDRAGGSDDEESDEEGNGSSKSKGRKDGDLGQASIPIVSLEHENLFEADLILCREMEDGALELAQGTLKVSVQWIYSSEFDEQNHQPEKKASGKLLFEATKRPLPKPSLSQELEHDFRLICSFLETITETLLDLETATADPLRRLHKRMLNAQAAGKTAEEAKVVEQRMVALINTQLLPRVARLNEELSKCCAAVKPFQDAITEAIQDYVDSQEFHKAQELTEIIRSISEAFAAEKLHVKALAQYGMGCSKDLRNLSSCFDAVFRRRRAVNAWILSLEKTMETFIAADKPWTVASKLQVKVDEIYFKMEAQMDGGTVISSPSNDALSARKIEPTASSSEPQAATSATRAQGKGTSSAEKRMERIQKEKRKQQRRHY
ncbi:Nadp-dependent oxidoreductase domain-containing protein 1, partial [Globisporangium splendens]